MDLKHFSRALISLGKEENIFDQLIADLVGAREKLDGEMEFKRYLLDRHVSLAQKKKALTVVFQDFISARTLNFLLLLIKHDQLDELDEIIDYAKKHFLHVSDIEEVVVESVVPMTVKQQEELIAVLTKRFGKKIILQNLLNKNILGGLRLRLGDQIIDASIAGKLRSLMQKIDQI
jgi:F-type H+-transporting ATPase subunit delta